MTCYGYIYVYITIIIDDDDDDGSGSGGGGCGGGGGGDAVHQKFCTNPAPRNSAVKRFIGRSREEDGIEHKELTHMELIDTQDLQLFHGCPSCLSIQMLIPIYPEILSI